MNNWEYFEEKYGAPIGAGAQCRVYRKGDTVFKVLSVGHDMFEALHEGYALAVAEKFGMRVSGIHGVYTEAGHIVVEMEYVGGEELLTHIVDALDRRDEAAFQADIDKMVDIQIAMHRTDAGGLASVRGCYYQYFKMDKTAGETLRKNMFRLLDTLPDGYALCHNDYHAKNILVEGDEYVVIDWDSAMIGDPAGDVAHSYLVGSMAHEYIGNAYLESYLKRSGMDASRVKTWLPLHAYILYTAVLQSRPTMAAWLHTFFADME